MRNLLTKSILLAFLCLFGFLVNGQVIVDFGSSSTSSCSPATINFNSLSSGPIKLHSWDFDNGTSSSFNDPSVIFSDPGVYSVKLTVTDTNNITYSTTKDITIYDDPVPSFTSDLTEICERDIVSFTNKSIKGSTPITTYVWDFGDGYVSSLENPVHRYTSSSTYTVKLRVWDSAGCTSETSLSNYIEVKERPEAAVISNDAIACKPPVSVTFNNNTVATNTSYVWDFGDGSSSTSFSPTHSFTGFGTYDVTMVATHSSGCKDSITVPSKVEIAPLAVDFTYPNVLCEETEVKFTEDVTPKLTTPTYYSWYFDDGSSASGKEVLKVLPKGSQSVKLKITNLKCTDEKTILLNVEPKPENTIVTPDQICGPNQFVKYYFNKTGIDTFSWRIDDAFNTQKDTGVAVLNKETDHYFKLYLKSDLGCEAVYIDTVRQSLGLFEITQDTGACVPYSFVPSIKNESLYAIDSIDWDLLDFGVPSYNGLNRPLLSISDTGVNYLNVRIKDEIGCKYQFSSQISGGNLPTASFVSSKDTICNKEDIKFTNTSTGPIKPNEFQWEMGGSVGNTRVWTPIVKEFPDDYEVTHVASHYGCSDTVYGNRDIHILGPYARYYSLSDSCVDSYKEIRGVLMGAETFFYHKNGTQISTDTNFFQSFKDGDSLRLIAANATTGCSDTFSNAMSVKGDAFLDWKVSADECAPAKIELIKSSYNLDSTKWFYNGTDTKQRQDTFRLTSSLGGVLNMKLKGYGKNGCEIVLDTNILITGARLKPRIGQSYGCFPKTFTLIDSFWNDADEFRYWVVDGDSISSDSLITIYTLDGLRDASSNVISIKLVGGTDSCVSSQQYNFAHSGVKFESMYSDSILDCSQSLYTFSISINNADAGLVDLYELVYNGDTLRDYIPKFSKSIELDGSMDTVYLTVLSKRGCRTTQELVFLKNKPALVPLFSSSDASASCPPLQVNFKDESSSKFGSVVSREWFINGQFFSTATNPSRIFSEPGAYTILLKTTDERGCSDSIVVDSFVRINGEQVEIDFGDTLFCSSDTVRCRVIQGDAVKYEWDMGDGTVIEGDEVLYHYSDSGVFPIQVLVSDSSNCKYPVLNPNEIRVYRNPEARFHSDIPCLNESMWVHDSSMYYGNKKSTEWWVDGLYSQNVSSVHHQNSSTDVPIKLKVEDEHGCLDSLVSLQKLYSIQANFQFDQGYICEQDSFTLAEDVVTDTTLESLNYFIDSTPLNVASSGKFVGVMQGTYDLGLIATNQAGCKDSIVKPGILKVAGSYTKSNSDIDFISVGEANEVLVTLIKDTTGIFEYYQVYNANTKIWESGDVNDTTLSLSLMKPYLNSVCLRAVGSNRCLLPDVNSQKEHCSIEARGESLSMARKVKWSQYIGWKRVEKYNVYRLENEDFKQIGTVPGDSFTYIDTVHLNCNEVQIYKVSAVAENISYSDTCHIISVWDYDMQVPKIRTVSVLNNDIEIKLEEGKVGQFAVERIELEREDIFGSLQNIQVLQSNSTYVLDQGVDVNVGAYKYKVRVLDECGAVSEYSEPAKSIFLSVKTDKTTSYPLLKWNKATLWKEQINSYAIFKESEGLLVEIGRTFGLSDTQFIDNTGDLACSNSACYVVEAYSTDMEDTSRSNLNCGGIKSKLYAPNAATPNNDNVNDGFGLRGLYIAQFHLEIYNMWGQKVFSTDKCMEDWDCTVDGEPAQDGTYFYVVHATGADSVRHNMKGTIHLIR